MSSLTPVARVRLPPGPIPFAETLPPPQVPSLVACLRPPLPRPLPSTPHNTSVGPFLPTSVDDLDKIIEASAGGSGGGGIGAAALRILALLQDTAEFLDKSRAGALSAAAAASTAAAGDSDSTVGGAPTATTDATLTPRHAMERAGGGGETTTSSPPLPSGNLDVRGGGFAGTPEEAGRRAEDGLAGGGQGEAAAVRVVGTCSMSDRGMLSLYGR